MIRGIHVGACVLGVLAASGSAAAQERLFVQGVAELVEATEGTYGDEGPRIARALDTMSRALVEWEREIAASAGGRAGAAPGETSRSRRTPLEEAAAGAPLLPMAAYRQGFERLAQGAHREAIDEFRRAASTDPLVTGPTAQRPSISAAIALLRQGRFRDARGLLEQSDALRDWSEARRIHALIYWAESDYDRSIEQLEAAIALNPADERSRLALSRVLSSAGRVADAERALQETIRVLPSSARAHWWLATTYERVNRFDDARREYERAAAGAVAGRSHLYGAIGRLASGAADLAGTVDAFSRAVRDDPDNPAWHRLLAGALLHHDRADDAIAEFRAALRIDPQDREALFGLGRIYLDTGRNQEAVQALRRATELKADAADALYALATALTRSGNNEEAARYFERVEQVQRQALTDRRRALSLDTLKEEAALRAAERDHARAAALWQQVVALEPQRASNHLALAAVLAGAGRLDAAIEEYERAATLGAEPAVYRSLADLYARAGRAPDAARARVMYEAALQRSGR